MSTDCVHGSFGAGNCPDCRMDRIEALLTRIADEVAPLPDSEDGPRCSAELGALIPPGYGPYRCHRPEGHRGEHDFYAEPLEETA